MRLKPTDETETEFIDMDLLLSLYLDEYKESRGRNMKRIYEVMEECMLKNQEENAYVCRKDLDRIMAKVFVS